MSDSAHQIRVGIIGCGIISTNHLVALSKLPSVQLAAVCDIIPERAERAASEYGCAAYTDYEDMIRKEHLDAVHICLPHYLHCPVTLYALRNGLDVLCEKPMHSDLAGAEEMVRTAEQTGRKLGIVFQNRYNPGSLLAKEMIEEGSLGYLKGLSGTVMWHRDQSYYDAGSWRGFYRTAGGGVVVNQAIHTLDLLRWLAHSDVSDVKASVFHHGETNVEVEDTAEGIIRFESGISALFFFSVNNCSDDNITVTAYCEKGSIRIQGTKCLVKYKDGTIVESQPNPDKFYGAKKIYGPGHSIQIAKFYDPDCREEIRNMTMESLKTQRLMDQVFRAAGKPIQ